MSVNQKMKSHLVFSENRINLANSVNFAQIKYSESEKDNKRYSNSSNKNNLYLDKEESEEKKVKINEVGAGFMVILSIAAGFLISLLILVCVQQNIKDKRTNTEANAQ